MILVVGDVVKLSAGDMIPADLLLFESRDFFVQQSGLTGESESVEKLALTKATVQQSDSLLEAEALAFYWEPMSYLVVPRPWFSSW